MNYRSELIDLELQAIDCRTEDSLRNAEIDNIVTIIRSGLYWFEKGKKEKVLEIIAEVRDRVAFLQENAHHSGQHEIHR